ncbi:undecaprenyl-phosphate glucose phosphotransferase [Neorhodopirellula pilleata]|uniref:UDP-glucose:undecaprenyl-phosphate glucose-1-phosphate transferase n=1 Tax=Neorhodopirellula pilleata TaxID=2714738 RepID=A0A5C6AVF1_9BACT|nr:undecaprenyl-phosphate glucose phosphotransferase [Neorhodopirellula pilleata]TWU03953.1 UDP-glucose:undecaprenyl-phosphate glucose-1-phosphate transferase [Neorhodopirellula pilleata]
MSSSPHVISRQPNAIFGDRHWYEFVQPCLDAASIMTSLVTVKLVARGYVDDTAWPLGLMAVIAFFLCSQFTGLHRRDRGPSVDNEIIHLVATWSLTVLVLMLILFATRYGDLFARSIIFAWVGMSPAMIGLTRMCLRIIQVGMFRRGIGSRTVAIAGWNPLGERTRVNIQREPELGFTFTGFYDDRNADRLMADVANDQNGNENKGHDATVASKLDCDSSALLGDLNDLVDAARAGEVSTVLVTLPMRAEKRIRSLLDELSDTTASVYIVPDFFVFELLHSRWTQVGGLPAVSVFENPLFGIDGAAKRIADLAIAAVGLAVISVPLCMIATAVKLTSPGPVFFRQRRYGLDGQEIRVWKFRTMRVCDDGPVVKQATQDDPRITPLGRILRRTSLDELPQLFNVIEGTMSLVGPRPHATAHNEQYRGLIRGYMMRHKVKPGITGLAQVSGCRGETETIEKMQRRVEFDHQYIRTWSLALDLRILFRTLLVVWKQPEAY